MPPDLRELFVAPWGNDNNDRAKKQPFVTVGRARKHSPQSDRLALQTPDDINRLQAAQQDTILQWLGTAKNRED